MALALLCRGNIEEKYRCKGYKERFYWIDICFFLTDIFSLVAYPSTDNDMRDVVDRQRLSMLFQQAIVVCI